MLAFIRKLFKKEDGATAIEYGLIAALIAVAIIAAAGSIGDSLDTMFTSVSTELGAAVTPSAPAPAPAPAP
jgi:pilus assembly protein Flp/PilA